MGEFDDIFDEVLDNKPKETQKKETNAPIDEKKDNTRNITNICAMCGKIKDNIAVETGCCLECSSKVIKGKKDDIHKLTGTCMICGKDKDNIASETASCQECDESSDYAGLLDGASYTSGKATEEIEKLVLAKQQKLGMIINKVAAIKLVAKDLGITIVEKGMEEIGTLMGSPVPVEPPAAVKEDDFFATPIDPPEPVDKAAFEKAFNEITAPIVIVKDTPTELHPASDTEKEATPPTVMMVHGYKGKGKTAVAISALYCCSTDKKCVVFSFDRKAKPVKKYLFNDDPRIEVIDCLKHLVFRPPNLYLKSCSDTVDYFFREINALTTRSDVGAIIIDGLEVLQNIMQGKIRYVGNKGLTEGIPWALWNIRSLDLKEVHNACVDIASNYLIYTTFTTTEEVWRDDEQINQEQPKWLDVVKAETDNLLRASSTRDEKGNLRFMLLAETCKVEVQTGAYLDVTGKKPYPFLLKNAPIKQGALM